MPILSASLDAFVLTSLAVTVPWLYFTRRSLRAPRPPSPPPPRLRNILNLFVLLHTLYILYCILVAFPANLFATLHIPLNAPVEHIRILLFERAGYDAALADTVALPKPLETLLARLTSFDVRTLYVRFGQAAAQDCEFCATYGDYALYAFSGAFLQYIRTIIVVGLVTLTGSHRERWRAYGVVALACAAVMEAYWVSTVVIKISRDGLGVIMWHDVLWTLRHILFLVLPPLLHLLPASAPRASPLSILPGALATLEQVHARLTLLKYAQGAVMRDPVLRETNRMWWEHERTEGELIRGDEEIKSVAERFGIGIVEGEGAVEGKLRASARIAVEALKFGFRHNGPSPPPL